ncbi:MAG: ABC transporter ATP-binding protein [Trueperaceae bacterium]|nr:ABC transporter ATP-binding protein [Trueperaceae bacterium]
MANLHTEHLSLGYYEHLIVRDLNLTLPVGKVIALVGANGSGKSTILKALARVLRPREGAAYLDGKAIHALSTKKVAQRLAILPQNPDAPEGLRVRELVSYGRFPHQRGFNGLGPEDRDIIDWALSMTGMTVFADRPVGNLSGGQRQRAWIAMALAQGTDVLLLDEPTTFLDMAHQLEVLELLSRLNRDEGRTIIMVVHDLNHASRFAHHMVAIAEGTIAAEGSPAEVMTPEILRQVFAIDADIITDPRTGVPLCIPYKLRPHDNRSVGL